MVNVGSRCAARLNVAGAVATAGVVMFSFVGVPPPVRPVKVDISAVRIAAVTTSLSAQWAALDQFVDTHADLAAVAAQVVGGGSSGISAAGATAPGAGSATAPTPLAATSTSLPTPQPAGAVAVIEHAIVSALSTAFLTLAKPLVSTPELAAVFGPLVFFGVILYGLVVGVPLTIFNSIAAPILNLLPFAAVPAPVSATPTPTAAVSTGGISPTATVSDPVTPSPKATNNGRALPLVRTPRGAAARPDTTGNDVAGQSNSTGLQSVQRGPVTAAGQSTDRNAGGQGVGSRSGLSKGADKAGAPSSRTSKVSHGSRSVRAHKGDS